MDWKIFLCLLLFSIKSSIAANNHGRNEDMSFIYQEIGLIKEENRDQNLQIELLKEMVMKSHTEDKIIPENKFTNVVDPKTKEPHPPKRPARLLPLQLLYGRKNDTNETNYHQPIRFYGPPADCSDLKQLGYTLNGFYLVKPDRNSALHDNNIKSVYCSFKQSEGGFDLSKIEKKVIHSKQIHFQAVATYIPYKIVMGSKYQNIFFQETNLNMGEAFNKNTGCFTAPKTGVYRFSIQMTLGLMGKLDVLFELYHRSLKDISSGAMGTAVRSIQMDTKNKMFHGLIDTTMKLNGGEIIYLRFFNREKEIIETISLTNPILFSGSLLEEVFEDQNKN